MPAAFPKMPKMPPMPKLPKVLVGIDMGYDTLKLALCRGSSVRKVASAPMPKNLLREGRVTSPEAMGEFIRQTLKENGMRHVTNAAVVLSNETSYIREVSMPLMSAEQLMINIPYEFNDYITDELKSYVFDYAMLSTPEDIEREREAASDDHAPVMELMLSAVQTDVLNDMKHILRKAGLKLVKAAPALCAYISLIRHAEKIGGHTQEQEYCLLDLGFQSIRMYMFRGDRHIVTRVLETGLSVLDEAIADAMDVDTHLAHTYLLTNYEGCQNQEACVNAYNNLAVELMRALNFYRFSNPDSEVSDVWLCGGGAVIVPLQEVIRETLDMNIHQAASLTPGGDRIPDCYQYIESIGITME
ncbi:MAG: pilus assembly protein PilM [Oscillospiraceae bacterium]|nr:pilus assembly protein PilM [Oscillospiraceae bacterium]